MNHDQHPDMTPQQEKQQQETIAALLSVSVVADRTLVRQTQRRVRARALEMVARRKQIRRRIGLTILAVSLVWLLMTPIVWGGFDQTISWQHFTDSEYQVIYLTGWLLPITLVTLVVGFMRARSQKTTRKLDSLVR
ncbi:MAG TPA: hypothetical protein VHX63_14130 [Acidobacteriaceae bacterium]|jgi:hypothetical protein|nr:hypothetical protein [Acidobacteriaceae bacterium]